MLVHLFEIEGEIECKPQARILELVAADIECKGLHDPQAALRKLLEQHSLVLDGGEIVGRRPVLRDVLGTPIDLVGLECLERNCGIAKILEA